MTRPTVSQAREWDPAALRDLADTWNGVAGRLQQRADQVDAVVTGSRAIWRGTAADESRRAASPATSALRRLCGALVIAAAEARDGSGEIGSARGEVLARVDEAQSDECTVADDGTVSPPSQPSALTVLLAGGTTETATALLEVRADELTRTLHSALDRMGACDTNTARAIDAAFDLAVDTDNAPEAVRPAGLPGSTVGDWPHLRQERIAELIAAMPTTERERLIRTNPEQVGNTDGIAWDLRVAANRINIANAILREREILDRPVEEKLSAAVPPTLSPADAERLWATLHADPDLRAATIIAHDQTARRRVAFYESLLGDVPDPTDPARRVPRQILAFDPDRSSLIEMFGDLNQARAVGVLVPGLNTTMETSADNAATARRFVAGSGGDVAMISYLGGPFPTGELAAGLADAANPRYALDMAPRLAAFSEDVERTVQRLDRPVPVTYLGHSYGGSILGTAERFGLTADRVVYVEAAGSGVGVTSPADWHNRNPDVLRFAMTAPGDWISIVQGVPGGPHGADPDTMPGVIPLAAGRRANGWPMAGPSTHSDVLNEQSDAWRNLLAVITGDKEHIRVRSGR